MLEVAIENIWQWGLFEEIKEQTILFVQIKNFLYFF